MHQVLCHSLPRFLCQEICCRNAASRHVSEKKIWRPAFKYVHLCETALPRESNNYIGARAIVVGWRGTFFLSSVRRVSARSWLDDRAYLIGDGDRLLLFIALISSFSPTHSILSRHSTLPLPSSLLVLLPRVH